MATKKGSSATVKLTLEGALRKHLNSHGDAFQQAVLREIDAQEPDPKPPWTTKLWKTEDTEVPVSGRGGFESRIDLVLTREPVILAVECKRIDPSFSHWCFVRSVAGNKKAPDKQVLLDRLEFTSGLPSLNVGIIEPILDIYELAVPIKMKGVRGATATPRKDLDNGIEQALRGAAGLVDLLADPEQRRSYHLADYVTATIVPVIFTTASLHVSDIDLRAETDLTTGDIATIQLQPREWVWLRQNVSKSLRPLQDVHDSIADGTRRISQVVRKHHTRCIAVVNANAIRHFLRDSFWVA